MKTACAVGLLLLALSGVTLAQQKEFGWVRANNQVTQLDPADFRAGRVYHPGENGGNIHVDVQARLPVTIAMAPAAGGQTQQEHPESQMRFELTFLCEHVAKRSIECPLLPNRPMGRHFDGQRKTNNVLVTA